MQRVLHIRSRAFGVHRPRLGGARPPVPAFRATVSSQESRAMNWQELQALVEEKSQESGYSDITDLENGPTNPTSLKRLFGKTDADIRVKLYRDHAAWCPYCQRVWLLLEEKRIPYTMEKINMRSYGDKPPAFLKKVPSGLLPVVELDGRIVTESAEIMMLLEETFPDVPLLPGARSPQAAALAAAGAAVRAVAAAFPGGSQSFGEVAMLPEDARLREAAGALLRLERDLFGLWCRWLFRPLDGDAEARARAAFEKGLGMADAALGQVGGRGPFFLGAELSLVDVMWAPFLERYNASLLYWKGFKLRNGGYENIDRWFEALEARSTYSATQSDHYTHCWDIPPQYGTAWPAPGSEAYAKAINGTDGNSWRLPLPPLNGTSMEPRSNVEQDGMRDQKQQIAAPVQAAKYRVEAAAKLVGNHAAVTRFCLRVVGSPGKHFSAPLADPAAKPGTEFTDPVGTALQLTALALLAGTEAAQAAVDGERWLGEDADSRQRNADAVAECLGYMRDRVGVPRDMQLPAARQLRAHLNWAIDAAAACV